MGRIEDAIARLQASGRAAGGGSSPRRSVGSVRTAEGTDSNATHVYSKSLIQIDLAELRRGGVLAPALESSPLVNQYRAIKRPLLRNAAGDVTQTLGNLLLVSSAFAGEGKTFTCLNLCLSIAQEQDWSVVLVDGDNAKRHLTKLLGAEAQPGLIDLLGEPAVPADSLVMPTSIPRLAFLPAGRRHDHATELLASERMAVICRDLAQDHRRMVVFDSAPLLMGSESATLAAQVGQTLLVVRAGHTPQNAVLEAREKLDQAKPINLVLNQAYFATRSSSYGDYAP